MWLGTPSRRRCRSRPCCGSLAYRMSSHTNYPVCQRIILQDWCLTRKLTDIIFLSFPFSIGSYVFFLFFQNFVQFLLYVRVMLHQLSSLINIFIQIYVDYSKYVKYNMVIPQQQEASDTCLDQGQQAHRRHMLQDVPHSRILRDRILCCNLQRAG